MMSEYIAFCNYPALLENHAKQGKTRDRNTKSVSIKPKRQPNPDATNYEDEK